MTKYKVQNLRSLREQMKAVARGELAAPADAAKPSFNSVDVVTMSKPAAPKSHNEQVKLALRAINKR